MAYLLVQKNSRRFKEIRLYFFLEKKHLLYEKISQKKITFQKTSNLSIRLTNPNEL